MERLTTNKDVPEMSLIELAHNSCYVKDRKARVRDYGNDFDARELAIKLLEKYTGIHNEFFTCDKDFDDFIMDFTQYGVEDILRLIAMFYTNLWAMADLRERLKDYEDLEEQGKLLKLPCAVGDTVYEVQELRKRVQSYVVIAIHTSKCGNFYCWELKDGKGVYSNVNGFSEYAIGEQVFLTWEEAEVALMKAMQDHLKELNKIGGR